MGFLGGDTLLGRLGAGGTQGGVLAYTLPVRKPLIFLIYCIEIPPEHQSLSTWRSLGRGLSSQNVWVYRSYLLSMGASCAADPVRTWPCWFGLDIQQPLGKKTSCVSKVHRKKEMLRETLL